MIKFEIKEKEYQLPDVISIKNYTEIFKIKDLFSDTYFAAKLINLVCGVPIEDLLQEEYSHIDYLASEILTKIPFDKPKFVDRFKIDGVDYGFIPDWKDMTFAEFADLDTLTTKKSEEILDNLHIIASIMFRPITEEKSEHDYNIEKYDVKKMKKRAKLFQDKLDITYVLGAQFFFIKFANKFLNYSHLSLIPKLSIWTRIKIIWTMRTMILRAIFRKPTDGSLYSTELLETITQITKKSTALQ
jgi:hypothetical protein